MEDIKQDILQIFNKLRKLEISYSNNNLQSLYREAISQEVFEKALSYESLRKNSNNSEYKKITNGKDFTGVFHLVLNIKVDANSPFMPFAFVANSDTEKKNAAKEIIKNKQKDIKYNFTNFIDDLFDYNHKKAVESISFKTSINKDNKIVIDNIIIDNVDFKIKEDYGKTTILNKLINEGGFVKILSEGYFNKCIAKELYFTILSFDYDINSGHKLTHFLIISEDEEECKYFIEVCVRNLRDIVSIIRTRYITDISKKNTYESIKSAVSAIMSRNLSHNLGSHYLYYTKVALDELADKSGNMGPYIRGAAKVLSYIQGRMDYLATIVSNDKYPYGSVNFKSQILDELTIDDFSKRHYGINPNAEFKNKLAENISNIDSIKELVEELSVLFLDSKYCYEETNDELRKKADKTIDAIQLQLRKLDKKSIYNRTTNYLLTNLIKSENYSRPDILGHHSNDSFRELYLYVRLWNNEEKVFDLFTGSSEQDIMSKEDSLKGNLSKINLALPGGTMSSHAFYNILENFIRNSAKYSWTDFRPENLKFTIALKIDEISQTIEITLYDNKRDALRRRDIHLKKTLLRDLRYRLSHTHILGENNVVDKENKGLKEMLFSAVWLKANESNATFAEIITKIEKASPRQKLVLISKYAFEFVSVNDEGIISNNYNDANLGLRFTLPLFTHIETLKIKSSVKELIKLHTDVVEVDNPNEKVSKLGRSYSQIFPRIICHSIPNENEMQKEISIVEQINSKEDALNTYKLKQSIASNLGNIDDFMLVFASVKEPRLGVRPDINHQILFDTHFSTQAPKSRIKEYYGKYAYVDTISGNNFTKTLQGLFYEGVNKRKKLFKSFNDLFLTYKIKESALTRITIIDERLFNNIRWNENVVKKLNSPQITDDTVLDIRSTALELTMKNIRILNFLEKPKLKKTTCFEPVDGLSFLYGNSFMPLGPCGDYPNSTHFLSIHLGLIEKLLKSQKLEEFIGSRGDNPLAPNRIKNLMKLLKSQFGLGLPNGVHICIHSGRGNFSKELEGPLKEYPFISLAALENAFNNSKYLLSQLFYNTIFIGKGEVNH